MKTALGFLVAARRCEIRDLEQLTLTCELVKIVSELVHCFQRERGTSNIFLGSGGHNVAAQRQACIAASVSVEAQWRAWIDPLALDGVCGSGGVRLFTHIALVLHGLDELPKLRADIQALQCSTGHATKLYNRLIAALLGLVFEAADIATDPTVSRLLVALFNLMQAKEYAGQERAAGAAAFALGKITPEEVQALQALIDLQEQCFQRFETFSAPESLQQWQALQSRQPLVELERMRRKLMAGLPTGQRDGTLAQSWFDCCSLRMDQVHLVESHLATSLQQVCAHRISASQAELEDHRVLLAALDSLSEITAPPVVLMPGDCLAAAPDTLLTGDGMGPRVMRSIFDSLQIQSQKLQAVSEELAVVRGALEERKVIERAKGLLMAHQGLSEEEAYRLLRQTAMGKNRRIIDVARAALSMVELLPVRS
ncbi:MULTISPECIES: nitrate- and nitrite sensing domain-containing protein [Giesbergeria]|uniref:Nitrate- and nitrite sensing domain-containing protein n=1 Tax=Giesbergeria sinuosa TaxID=80883 RepID=A0ABV9QH06_9BURK